MSNRSKREIPFFVDSDDKIVKWENDSYLVDRKKLFNFIFQSGEQHNIIELLNISGVSTTNYARLLNELVNDYGAIDIDEKTIRFPKEVKQKIFLKRKEIFFPKIEKIWKTIPEELKRFD